MFITKSLLTAAMLVGAANAFTGTANLGFTGVTTCGCSPSNGPFAVAIPAALAGTHVCCNEAITLSYNGKSVTAIYSGTYDAGAGTQNVALTATAFDVLEDNSGQTSLSPVTWAFN
ncbi:hypothetical protein B0H17DRAFT_1061573 [Mycena rosella]|uniref:Uncharacterized protein n=1 Tax=Mycena rosella TaxID=1033263 RepID=A0AAD7DHZ8_MYCRO|nr:hypothetical protein B0H17DRAFT_1061573 [Mycena rosella]